MTSSYRPFASALQIKEPNFDHTGSEINEISIREAHVGLVLLFDDMLRYYNLSLFSNSTSFPVPHR